MNHKSCRSPSKTTNDNSFIVSYDFHNSINHVDKVYDEDYKLPEEFVKTDQARVKGHPTAWRIIWVVNLGTNEEAKEDRVGSTLLEEVKAKLIKLLKGYMDVFAWSYQDMPDLDTDIVVHHLPLREECPPVK